MLVSWVSRSGHQASLSIHRHEGEFANEATFDLRDDGGDYAVTNITREAAHEVVNKLAEAFDMPLIALNHPEVY